MDVQKEYSKSNRVKDKIIILLIVLMFAEAVVGYLGFTWYESQFDYVVTETTETTTETKTDVDMDASGENANEDWQDVLRVRSVSTLLFILSILLYLTYTFLIFHNFYPIYNRTVTNVEVPKGRRR